LRGCRNSSNAPATELKALARLQRFTLSSPKETTPGHIVLSRRIAESGHYPAIDVEASVSRAMHEISSPAQMQIARQFRQTLATYQQNRDLIAVGAYQRGSDPRVDNAVTLWPRMQKFLQQDIHERVDFAASLTALQSLLADSGAAK
jgi:flagellum-specific ATP synthase